MKRGAVHRPRTYWRARRLAEDAAARRNAILSSLCLCPLLACVFTVPIQGLRGNVPHKFPCAEPPSWTIRGPKVMATTGVLVAACVPLYTPEISSSLLRQGHDRPFAKVRRALQTYEAARVPRPADRNREADNCMQLAWGRGRCPLQVFSANVPNWETAFSTLQVRP